MSPPSVLARRPEHLTAAWAQRVVDRCAPGARVGGVRVEAVEVGTTTRVRLRVAHDAPLPGRWFVKLPSRRVRARVIAGLPRLPQAEVRFYTEIAPGLDVRRPVALAGASGIGFGFTVVVGDVTEEGGTAGRPGDTLDATQAAAAVDLLARLHASYWEHPDLDGTLAWLAGPVRRLEDRLGSVLAVPLMRRGLARAGAAVPAGVRPAALRYARHRRAVMARWAAGPRTLVHHDCHPGNLFWTADGPGLLDWQLVRIGDGAGDLAYLLATGLEPELRRAYADALIDRYRAGLAARGVPEAGLAGLDDRVRARFVYAFEAMVATLAVGGLMPDDVAVRLVARTAAAVEDHRAFDALG